MVYIPWLQKSSGLQMLVCHSSVVLSNCPAYRMGEILSLDP